MRFCFFLRFFIYVFIVLFFYHFFFFIKYFDFKGISLNLWKEIVFVSLRFDLATTAYFTIPVLILIFLPVKEKNISFFRTIFSITYIWLLFLIIYLFVDLIYYQFSFRHLSFEILNAGGELKPLIKIGVQKYKVELLILTIFVILLSSSYFRVFKKNYFKRTSKSYLLNFGVFFILIGVLIVFSRGGFQMKPIKLSDAFVFENPTLGHLCLNGFYTTLKTVYEIKIKKNKDMLNKFICNSMNMDEIRDKFYTEGEVSFSNAYPIYRKFDYKESEFKKLNIVIFVMESWSGKFSKSTDGEIDATPFFTNLSKKGLILKRFFANGQRSIEGISAIVTSIPPWGGLILSENPLLSQLPVNFLPNILNKHGYETIFIHGAKYGSLGLSSFAKHVGFKKYISKEDLLRLGAKDDGVWGVYDEDTFLIANKIFEEQTKPFMALIFSLSSHTPYKLPSDRFKVFDKSKKEFDFLNSLYYSDYALSKFFSIAEKSKYFKNTIFVILGDHTEGKTTKNTIFERFHVPCLFYAPGMIKPEEIYISSNQTDIAPTLLDMIKSSDYHASFGMSVLRKKKTNIGSILAYGDIAVYNRENYFLLSSIDKTLGLYKDDENKDVSGDFKKVYKELINEFNCYGYFLNKLISENRLFPIRQFN